MLRDCGYSGDDVKAGADGGILQLRKSILIGPVAVNAEQNGLRSVSADAGEAFCGRGRHAAAVGGDRDQGKGVFLQRNAGKVGRAVCEIKEDGFFFPFLCQHICRFLCSAGGAETDFIKLHLRKSPCLLWEGLWNALLH